MEKKPPPLGQSTLCWIILDFLCASANCAPLSGVVESTSAEHSLIHFLHGRRQPPPPSTPSRLIHQLRPPLFSARRSDAPSSSPPPPPTPHPPPRRTRTPRPAASWRQQIISCALSLACATQRMTRHDDKRSLDTKPNHTVRNYRFRNGNRIGGAAAHF